MTFPLEQYHCNGFTTTIKKKEKEKEIQIIIAITLEFRVFSFLVVIIISNFLLFSLWDHLQYIIIIILATFVALSFFQLSFFVWLAGFYCLLKNTREKTGWMDGVLED